MTTLFYLPLESFSQTIINQTIWTLFLLSLEGQKRRFLFLKCTFINLNAGLN